MCIGKQEKKIYVSKIVKSYIKYLNGPGAYGEESSVFYIFPA